MTQTKQTTADEYQVFLNRIGENVRHYRKLHFDNQIELSMSVGMNICTISRIESGLSNPKIETIFFLAKAFGVDPIELLRGSETKVPENEQDSLNIPGYGELSDEQKKMVYDVAMLMTNQFTGKILHTSKETT